MKTIYIIIILLFVIFFIKEGQSQTYFPFPDSSAIWRTNWGEIDCQQNGWPISQYQYLLLGDTIIGGKIYVKIIRTGFISPYCPPVTPFSPQYGYQGAYRQDISAKKVYLMLPDSTTEILFYDFSIVTGDTLKGYFRLPNISFCDYPIVDFTDSIMINNSMRKRIHITGNGCVSYFIEGIGSSHGLMENLQSFEGGGELLCFTQNDSVIYRSNPLVDCQLITSVFMHDDVHTVKLYPNPAVDYLRVTGVPAESPINFIIYNSLASLVKSGRCHTDQIPINGIGNGLFFLKLSINEGTNLWFKFISQQN